MIPVIHGSSYAARSSPRSKRCNAPISMQTAINNDGYLYMASYNQAVRSGRLQEDHNVQII